MYPIKSSEIASYIYCPACWWKGRIEGVQITADITRGEKHHHQISSNQESARKLYIIIIATMVLIAIVFAYGVLKWF